MILTTQKRKLAAKEARKLAGEIVEGRGPDLNQYSYCDCAAGEIVKRVFGVEKIEEDDEAWKLARDIDGMLPDNSGPSWWDEGLVSSGLRHGPDGVVFPLLALADVLETEP